MTAEVEQQSGAVRLLHRTTQRCSRRSRRKAPCQLLFAFAGHAPWRRRHAHILGRWARLPGAQGWLAANVIGGALIVTNAPLKE